MGRTIFVDPDLYPPRMNWRFCHELAHILLNHPSTKSIAQENEFEADELATELMLPRAEFEPLSAELDLPELKVRFPHASWEVIARKRIRFRPAVLSIFDNEVLTYRKAPQNMNYPRQLSPEELEVVQKCYEAKEHFKIRTDLLFVAGYYIDENPDVKRVILLTEVLEAF